MKFEEWKKKTLQKKSGGAGLAGLNIQRFGEGPDKQFLEPAAYPYLSVASPSCHDMPPIRAWWEDCSPADRDYFMARVCAHFPPNLKLPAWLYTCSGRRWWRWWLVALLR